MICLSGDKIDRTGSYRHWSPLTIKKHAHSKQGKGHFEGFPTPGRTNCMYPDQLGNDHPRLYIFVQSFS